MGMTRQEKELVAARNEWELFRDRTDIDDERRARTEWEFAHKMSLFAPYTVGIRLSQERKLSGLRQDEVAAALGVHTSTISDWETGKHDITLKDAHRLMMLYRLIPGSRTWEKANLNDLTRTPMDVYETFDMEGEWA